ncbi:hypothetical protein DL96DRAFT_1615039 [Flagelloscypha sp. PMI_526]|nr:hypothetical protein DL96DRAFT_1615039 [Flagelloscypha sp. PMI_526]
MSTALYSTFDPSSPVPRHFSSSNPTSRQEELINAYEAEEERIINTLSRKLERLREEKIDLENTLEAESESHVNKLSRELTALRMAQSNPTQYSLHSSGHNTPLSPISNFVQEPNMDMIMDSLKRENESLRGRLVDMERDYIRISRLNEIYLEELIEHRNRLGMPVDNLVGMIPTDPFSLPTHRRRRLSSSSAILHAPQASSSAHLNPARTQPTNVIPIPRPPSQIHRPSSSVESANPSILTSPSSSTSNSSSENPFSSSVVPSTTMTTPASTNSLAAHAAALIPGRGTVGFGLSYPSVPPPSLSSSFGSPSVSYFTHSRFPSSGGGSSPSVSRRNSNAGMGVGFTSRRGSIGAAAGTGNSSGGGRGHSLERERDRERYGRVAETGSLVRQQPAQLQASTAVGIQTAEEIGGGVALDGLEELEDELEFDPE